MTETEIDLSTRIAVNLNTRIAVLEERVKGLDSTMTLRIAACERVEQNLVERIDQEKVIANERRTVQEQALALQAKEYERRLTGLNHAHETAMQNWSHSLPRELFDAFEKEYDRWKLDITAQLSGTITWTAVGGIIVVVIGVILHFWKV